MSKKIEYPWLLIVGAGAFVKSVANAIRLAEELEYKKAQMAKIAELKKSTEPIIIRNYEIPNYEPPTYLINPKQPKPLWFNGSQGTTLKVSGKRANNQYKSRKQKRNNKHK